MSIEIKRVETKKDLAKFIDFHYDLYKGNAYDAPTLFFDDMNTLSRDKNVAFDFCEAEYFMAYKDGKLAGRVAPSSTIAPTRSSARKTCALAG